MKNPPKFLMVVVKIDNNDKKNKIEFKKAIIILVSILIIVSLLIGMKFYYHNENNIEENNNIIINETSKESEEKKLVLKSISEYNKIIEYTFKNNIVSKIVIFEQFEGKEKFEQKKDTYNLVDNIEIINIDEEQLSIRIEKKDLGTDAEMSYEQIYDKYLVQIIDAYQIVN